MAIAVETIEKKAPMTQFFRGRYSSEDNTVQVNIDLLVCDELVDEYGKREKIPVLVSMADYQMTIKAFGGVIVTRKLFTVESDIPDTFRWLTLQANEKQKFRLERAKLPNGGIHMIATAEEAFESGDAGKLPPVLLAWDGDFISQFYRILTSKYTTPIREEWAPWLWAECLDRDYVRELDVYAPYEGYTELRAARLLLRDDELGWLITKGLTSGMIFMPDGEFDATLEGVESVTDYLSKNPELAKLVTSRFSPVHSPTDELDPLISTSTRKWFMPQAHVIQAIVKKHLDDKQAMILVGEPGVGKTSIMPMVPYVLFGGNPFQAAVMVPGHLVRKWKREIEAYIPGARAIIVQTTKVRKGAEIVELSPVQVLEQYRRYIARHPEQTIFLIFSKETAKLGYFRRPAVTWSERRQGWVCPDCGHIQEVHRYNEDPLPAPPEWFDSHTKRNHRCSNEECRTILWSADNKSVHRIDLATYLKKTHTKLDYFIADELHELKGDTAQGETFATLMSLSKYALGGTGTLLGGYADDLFRIKSRMDSESLRRDGIGHNEVTKFVTYYGIMERWIRKSEESYRVTSKGRKNLPSPRRRPGISPLLFVRHLLDICVFLDLADLGHALPPYSEEVRLVDMEANQGAAYRELQDTLKGMILGFRRGGSAAYSRYLVDLLSYPDRPWANDPIVDQEEKDEEGNPKLIYQPKELPDISYPKDQEMIKIVQEHREKGRRCIVLASFTDNRDVLDKLENQLAEAGIKARVLRSNTVKNDARELWLQQAERDDVDVVLCNPELIKTGLDLYSWPTVIFYQPTYSIFTLIQASRRPYRPFQELPVMVYFLAYRNTMQATALELIGKKYEAAMTVQGKFSEDGLRALSGGMDMMTEMARRLVDEIDSSESAEAYWDRIRSKGGFVTIDLSTVKVTKKKEDLSTKATSALDRYFKSKAAKMPSA